MASFRKKKLAGGGDSWEVRINIAGHPPLSKSFDDWDRAVDWANKTEARIRLGGTVSLKAEKVLVRVALEEYLAHNSRTVAGSDETVSTLTNTKRYAVESVIHHLGDYAVGKLNHKKLNSFLKRLQETPIPPPATKTKTHKLYKGDQVRTYSPGSARKLFYALKTAVEWHALEHGYSGQIADLFKGVDVPPAWSAPRERRLEGDEEQRLMDACHGMYKDPRGWQLLIGLALETAMRAGELLGMRWDEVKTDPSHRFIVIPKEREKTRKGRQVPLSAKAITIIEELRGRSIKGEARVFGTFPNSSVILGRGFKRITTRAKCDDLRFHDLRHEATSRFFERTSLQMMEIAAITGHTQLGTLQRYANLRPSILSDKLDARQSWSDYQRQTQQPAPKEGNPGEDNAQIKLVLENLKKAGLVADVIADGSRLSLILPDRSKKATTATRTSEPASRPRVSKTRSKPVA